MPFLFHFLELSDILGGKTLKSVHVSSQIYGCAVGCLRGTFGESVGEIAAEDFNLVVVNNWSHGDSIRQLETGCKWREREGFEVKLRNLSC